MKLFIFVLFSSFIYPSPFSSLPGKGLQHYAGKHATVKLIHYKPDFVKSIPHKHVHVKTTYSRTLWHKG